MKKQREQNSKRLSQATNKANNLDNATEKVNDILKTNQRNKGYNWNS